MNDYRENYFNPSHEESPDEYETGGDRYNSELDRVTEQEMVPDIVERLTTRYDIEYNVLNNLNSHSGNHLRRIFKLPGLSKIRLIKIIKHLLALIPRSIREINDIDVIIIPINAQDTGIDFTITGKSSYPVIVRAYLASSMIDMTPTNDNNDGSGCLSSRKLSGSYSTNFWFTPAIPFKQNDELIVYYK